MRTRFRLLLAAFVLMLMPCVAAFGSMQDYEFTTGEGKGFDMSDTKPIFGEGTTNQSSEIYDIGFEFEFDGSFYSTFSISSNGMMALGKSTVSSAPDGIFEKQETYPVIAPFLEPQVAITNSISFKTVDSKEGSVLVVQWNTFNQNEGQSKGNQYTYQARLYQGTNVIEFWYGPMTQSTQTNARIGMAGGGDNFVSIYMDGKKGIPTPNYKETMAVNVQEWLINENTLYTFTPGSCSVFITGNPKEGGTDAMAEGDLLLSGMSAMRGSSREFRPFQLTAGDDCKPQTFSFWFEGEFAGEYWVNESNVYMEPGQTIEPTIGFAPGCTGERPAILVVRSDRGFETYYQVGASGDTRLDWIANFGGEKPGNVNDGAVLLEDQRIGYGTETNFSPFTIQDLNGESAPAKITYTLTDPTGQYWISKSGTVEANGTHTPVIRFRPTRFGFQTANLRVTADCETRNYTLRAYSTGIGAEFRINGEVADAESPLFVKAFECAGEGINTLPVEIRSVGNEPLVISSASFFRADSVYAQGVPGYPVLRDRHGNRLRSVDYFLTEFPGVAPAQANPSIEFPLVLQPGTSRTVYLNFVPQIPGKRHGRAFITTNAMNFNGNDREGGPQMNGLLTFDLFGKGIGSMPSTSLDGATLKPIAFEPTKLRESRDTTITIYNSGACNLRIDLSNFGLGSGDISDFSIVSALNNMASDQAVGSFVLAPGDSTTITIRFSPIRSGSRRATITMQTNDSTLQIPGLTERGAFYWDVFGVGTVGTTGATALSVGTSVIDDPAAGSAKASAVVENSARERVRIVKMEIIGADQTEFTMDPAKPWPTVPFELAPGSLNQFAVIHTPTAGSLPGEREAELRLLTSDGDTLVVVLRAQAGARTLVLNPTSLFNGVTVPVGKAVRQTVMITNNGTVPVKLGTTTITGANAGDYLLSPLPRLVLAPGQTEYFEITYRPVTAGTSVAALNVASNATNGTQTATLGGIATKLNAVSGVENGATTGGMTLGRSTPNPVRHQAEISYSLARAGQVSIELFDNEGRLVRTLEQGNRDAGAHHINVSVDDLPSGVYIYRMTSAEGSVSQTMTVVK